ncbi:MAG: hypothetical protein AAFO07_27205, partial [Bacteroidota bacterium]
FDDLAIFFECLVNRMLTGVRIKALEKLRSFTPFEFNRGTQSKKVVPIILDEFRIDKTLNVLVLKFS